MSDKKYTVPAEGLKAAHSVTHRIAEHDTITAAVRKFIGWQDEKLVALALRLGASPGWGVASSEAIEAVRWMYLAPEPEIAPEIEDLRHQVDADRMAYPIEPIMKLMTVAFRRGQRAGR
jgi:hypothetical protein